MLIWGVEIFIEPILKKKLTVSLVVDQPFINEMDRKKVNVNKKNLPSLGLINATNEVKKKRKRKIIFSELNS